jgi:diacylglycerol kinase family enzyme
MRIRAIINARAGTLINADHETFARVIGERLRTGGHDVQVDMLEPEELERAVDEAVASDIDVLVIAGGDGTIKAAAAKLVGKQIALGIIPLGTLNRLARDLNLPFDPAEAASVIAQGQPRAIDVADVNGHIFLCSSLLGLPLRVAEQRQALRGAGTFERLSGYAVLLKNFLANRRRFTVEIDDGSRATQERAMSIAVSNNPFAREASPTLSRTCLDSGKLALYLSKHESGGAMSWAILKRLFGKWDDQDPHVEEVCAKRIVLRSERREVRLSNDGEIERLSTPLTYTIKPRALRIMVAAADATSA